MVYKTKWQNDFASETMSMTDKEIFDLIAFEYDCVDRFTDRDKWKYNLLTQTFQIRMEWVKFTLKEKMGWQYD